LWFSKPHGGSATADRPTRLLALDLKDADHKFIGEGTSDVAGVSVSGAGDVDGDGLDDLLVGALDYLLRG